MPDFPGWSKRDAEIIQDRLRHGSAKNPSRQQHRALGDDEGYRGKTIRYPDDSKKHKTNINKITNPVPGELYPGLIEDTGRFPPEDVGVPPGSDTFCEVLANLFQPDHEHRKEWYGATFNPDQPEPDELKFDALKLVQRWIP